MNCKRLILLFCLIRIFYPLPHVGAETELLTVAVHRGCTCLWPADADVPPSGFHIDAMNRIAENARAEIRYEVMDSWENMLDALTSGRADLIAGMDITEDRKETVTFLPPLETYSLSVFIRKDGIRVSRIEDLKNRKVAAVKGGAGMEIFSAHPEITLVLLNDIHNVLFALLCGEADALVFSGPETWAVAEKMKVEDHIRQAGILQKEIFRGIATAKGDTALKERILPAVETFLASEAYQTVYRKWRSRPPAFRISGWIGGISLLLVLSCLGLLLFRHLSALVQVRTELTRSLNEKTEAEKKLLKTNRRLQALTLVREAVIHADEEQELLEQISNIIQESGEYPLLWIGYKMENRNRDVRIMAYRGFNDHYIRNLKITWGNDKSARGPAGRAIRTGKAQVFYVDDPDFALWRESAERQGFKSVIGLPLRAREETIGVLVVYSEDRQRFGKTEVAFLKNLADSINFGISTLRNRLDRKKTEKALIESEMRYRSLFQNAQSGIGVATPEGDIINCNSAMFHMIGGTREDLRKTNLKEIFREPERMEMTNRSLETQNGTVTFEAELHNINGYRFTANVSIRRITYMDEPALLITVLDVSDTRFSHEQAEKSRSSRPDPAEFPGSREP